MAAMALRLRRPPDRRLRLYSSSSDDPGESDAASKLFGDIKARLRQSTPPPPPPRHPASPPPPPPPRPSKVASFEEIRKNLAEFRRRSAPPDPADLPSSQPPPISFQEIYKKNLSKGNVSSPAPATPAAFSFDTIRESLRHLRESPPSAPPPTRREGDSPLSLKTLKEGLKLRPPGTESFKDSIFKKGLGDSRASPSAADQTEFVKMYSHKELGEKLQKLRPEDVEGKNWFSLQELNERLKKLRVMEEKESESRIGGVSFKDLRDSLLKLREAETNKNKVSSMQRHSILSSLTGETTPAYMSLPPKEHLVERYFHPDNMSSAEKLKLELKRVREEFKMSESDCGSTRVQIAQLTTKIKHLSTALHKKDKHSKKGLQEMVQRRKKLLKYLRRTDWDSYSFVLSKLGLRDNPDYKC